MLPSYRDDMSFLKEYIQNLPAKESSWHVMPEFILDKYIDCGWSVKPDELEFLIEKIKNPATQKELEAIYHLLALLIEENLILLNTELISQVETDLASTSISRNYYAARFVQHNRLTEFTQSIIVSTSRIQSKWLREEMEYIINYLKRF